MQVNSDEKHWQLWRHTIRKCFISKERKLRVPLGNWSNKDDSKWVWFVDVENKHLFEWTHQTIGWRMYKRDSGRGDLKKYNKFRFIARVLHKPSNVIKATVIKGQRIFNRVTLMG